jgi:hypothetical protein
MSQQIAEFIAHFEKSFTKGTLVKLTLGKPRSKSSELKNIYIRPMELKKDIVLSFTYRYQTKDEVKNYDLETALESIKEKLGQPFMKFHLFTIEEDFELSINKKGKGHIRSSPPNFTKAVMTPHDHQKKRFVDPKSLYLNRLEITDSNGKVRLSRNDKFKQINKYIEIVEALIEQIPPKKDLKIVDMGSGKGYLTFALYDFLKNEKKKNVNITGVELRDSLIKFCNELASESGFEGLKFEKGAIVDYQLPNTDVLIALHACDIATDEAIFKGIQANASLIVCAPCCHKQIRKDMTISKESNPIVKYGILTERLAEMLTDTIRALILELNGYDSKIFEFISSEHTGKNLMIAAIKTSKVIDKEDVQNKIDLLKKQYGIQNHYLETLFNKSIEKICSCK